MGREIKFRAWSKEYKVMSYGPNAGLTYGESINLAFDDDDMVFMQYTGLKDKNGVEIYEGDILQYSGERGDGSKYSGTYIVEWSDTVGYDEPGIGYNISSEETKNEVVIGNIYENPELLNNKEKK